MWVYSSLSRDKVEYTHIEPLCKVHVWNKFSDRIFLFRFKSNFQISNIVLRFQINSNEFSRYRSFGHEIVALVVENLTMTYYLVVTFSMTSLSKCEVFI